MSDETKAPDPISTELSKYQGELVPGAIQELAGLWSGTSLAGLSPDRIAQTIRERLDGPLMSRYKNPEAASRTLPDGGTPSELRLALERNSSRLVPGAVDALVAKLGHAVAGRKPGEVAAHVEKFLHSRDAHDFVAVRPELPAHEARIRDLLTANFNLPDSRVEELARDRSGQLRGMPEKQLIQTVARTLRIDPSDARITGRAADPFGTRPAPTPKPPARDESGQFKKDDEPPPRRSLVR
jgi:hypothetical protein